MADPANYDKWSYIRTNADGLYADFIAILVNSYKNKKNHSKVTTIYKRHLLQIGTFFRLVWR